MLNSSQENPPKGNLQRDLFNGPCTADRSGAASVLSHFTWSKHPGQAFFLPQISQSSAHTFPTMCLFAFSTCSCPNCSQPESPKLCLQLPGTHPLYSKDEKRSYSNVSNPPNALPTRVLKDETKKWLRTSAQRMPGSVLPRSCVGNAATLRTAAPRTAQIRRFRRRNSLRIIEEAAGSCAQVSVYREPARRWWTALQGSRQRRVICTSQQDALPRSQPGVPCCLHSERFAADKLIWWTAGSVPGLQCHVEVNNVVPRAWEHRPDGQRAGHRDGSSQPRLETAFRDLLEEMKQRILPCIL